MSQDEVVRAWKDSRHYKALPSGKRAELPANPAGAVELPEGVLDDAAGGTTTQLTATGCTTTILTPSGVPWTYPTCTVD